MWADYSGVVQLTVYDSGKGYIGVYCADDGTIETLDKSKAGGLGDCFDGTLGYGDKLFVHTVPTYYGALPGYSVERTYIYVMLGVLP